MENGYAVWWIVDSKYANIERILSGARKKWKMSNYGIAVGCPDN